jgi:hypothetical protein
MGLSTGLVRPMTIKLVVAAPLLSMQLLGITPQDWFAQNQAKLTELDYISTRGLFFQ